MNSGQNKPLTSTMENYLEAIFNLNKEKSAVRVKDIARRLGVKMPTVTNMLKTLNERGLIEYEKYEYLELTEEGSVVGKEIDRRHHVLRSFLTDILGIDPVKADEEACKMEHAVGTTTMDRFVVFMEFIQSCPRTGENWLQRFEEFRVHGKDTEKCMEHMKAFANGFGIRIKDMERREESQHGTQHG
ncbi:MAG: metal-dependent transcriptional regulator [Deltaproteobacteria bacterium]|nr:metal-dependent transcriptional regulator [Deltaproteobacteria bacterium]MBW2050209.1 metal-dependent transcriptional regulator [Deltaproteobacteria bacterium]MBW2112956.1 metal-dependent transcriptional regulator [Deltaproteobacteria bacterium]MBW2354788.1 metal-dependent transcriptional regulator [Deltaproteobacteria bacterium]HDZ23993.1 metal-dependent transcriptional regulator [Desulfobacteraceae bacterium]